MNTPLRRIIPIVLLIAGVVIGMAAQRYWGALPVTAERQGTPAGKILFYRHPMNPSITSDKKLKDEMGMDYIPVYEGDGPVSSTAAGAGVISVAPQVIQTMGVRSARVTRSEPERIIDAVGYVGVDEDKIRREQVRVEGWVEKLHVNFAGGSVRKGDLLFELYAPKLVSTGQEYVHALSVGDLALQRAARERLARLGLGEAQIAALERTRHVPRLTGIYAQADGVVQNLAIRPGAYVEPGMETVTLADLSSVWILADVFGRQAEWVKPGAEAEARFADVPGKVWRGRVDYIYPDINAATRTLRVRLRFENPDRQLKSNMYASVLIKAGEPRTALHIPREALIRTGAGERVIVALGEGRFAPRAVATGIESGERVEIVSGLNEGDTVVTSGQFLLDSESSLQAGLARLSAPEQDSAGESSPRMTEPAHATGVVNEIHGAEVNISHEPVPSLNWPAMTMDFRIADGAAAALLKPGARVEFEFHEQDGEFVISKITPLAGAAP